MKTFDKEYGELTKWLDQSLNEAEEEIARLPVVNGYDDRDAPIRNAVWHEWNRRLILLKMKYKIELSLEEESIKEIYKM